MTKTSEYRLNVNFGDNVIGTLELDRATNLLQLNYSEQWQHEGFAIASIPDFRSEQLKTKADF